MLQHIFNGQNIRVRATDNYLSANDMLKAVGKQPNRVSNWLQNKDTSEYLLVVSSVTGIPVTGLVDVLQGGKAEGQGTWMHPDVAIAFAQWCNKAFGYRVTLWVRELMTTGKVELKDSINPVTGEIKGLKEQYEELEKKLEEVERYWEAEQILRIKAQGKMRKAKNMLKENIADTEYYSSLVDNYKDYLRYNHGDLATTAKVVNWVAEFYRSYGGNCEKVEDMEEVSTGLLKRTLIVMKSVQDAGVLKEEHAKELRGIVREASRKGLL